MNKSSWYGILFLSGTISSCPIQINNDSDTPLIITDPHGTQALCLLPGQTQIIDPSLPLKWYYFPLRYLKKETLYVYAQDKNNLFNLKYILRENYCAPGIEKLSFHDIAEMTSTPNKRFKVTTVTQHHTEDSHAAHSH